MSEAQSLSVPADGPLDGLNSTVGDLGGPSFLQYFQDLDFLLLEAKLVFSALAIIYLGAHSALRRPPSAAPAKDRKPGQKDDEDERVSQGLEPSDAIMFPVMAAIALVSLYYLMQWLQDPNILNKILRWYMSAVSIVSLLSLYAHGIEVMTSLVFPRFWRASDGSLRAVDQKTRSVKACDDVGNPTSGAKETNNPLPGPLALLAAPARAQKVFWEIRSLLTRHWMVKLQVHGIGKEEGKIKFAHMVGMLMAVATAIVYSTTTSPFLSNMLGYGMCYGSFLLLSPTDYLTSTLVLVGLFFYDIVMVFYTPYMVTVATKLDVPIKLTFEAAQRKSILGLGDIVVPGMVIALALRFDLWMHYVRKIKYETADLQLIEKDPSGAIVSRNEVKHKEVKARYVNAKGAWGDSLWVRGTMFLSGPKQLPPTLEASRFPKTYFYASMVGYFLGMLVTLAMLLIFKRGQPALLYLVPGVLGSLWLTGLVRGEIRQMWTYTEDGSIDTIDVVVDLDGDGKAIKTIGELKDGVVDTTKDKDEDEENKKKESEAQAQEDAKKSDGKGGHKVFLLSIETVAEDDEA
ncbi:signal peptide peptidase-domain-containing protein [Ilyonectria robusta]|uniref:signal peptide peptidase-domain-containing protein n=1 Tax=Ilyonectria robusta TaxID=1079257 RepID=UPI001E8D74C9|nr:signal peptide peptidase-domain-containing protein [Ilyonectria robusta]KAH8729592.1 signal peptide peptidase-domain-containing protein [Ilyonectria robusta]